MIIGGGDNDAPVAELQATGLFSNIGSLFDDGGLTISALAGYNSVLAYTDEVPVDSTNLGNVLQQFADLGGRVVLATYAFSAPWAISGGIMGPGYSPLLDSGVNGSLSGALTQVSSDPIFNGVNLANATYFQNGNYAVPTLANGAALLATDGNGVNLIAVNAARNVYGFNIFPGSGTGTTPDTFRLFANALDGGVAFGAVPEPSTWAMMIVSFASLGFVSYRAQRKAASAA